MIDTRTVPEIPTKEWFDAVEADRTLTQREKKLIADKGHKIVEQIAARENLAQIQEERDAQKSAIPHMHQDPDRAILHAAKKLQTLIDAHIFDAHHTKIGSVNTVLNYILAHIYLLEGVKLSKRPLQDLRNIHTEEHAAACGIAHRNLAFIWQALCSIEKSKSQLPLGNEPRLADLATNLTRHAEKTLAREEDAKQTLSAAQRRTKQREHAKDARKALFPDLDTTSEIPVAELYKNVQVSQEGPSEQKADLKVQGERRAGDVARTAGHGTSEAAEVKRLASENKRLIEQLIKKK